MKLTTAGAPALRVTEATVTRAEAPELLEYNWGDHDMRWELEAFGGGTRLTLWTNIGRRFIAMGAAGWHICFDVLDHLLSGTPIGRMVGGDAVKFGGWKRLHAEYARLFGMESLTRRLRRPKSPERRSNYDERSYQTFGYSLVSSRPQRSEYSDASIVRLKKSQSTPSGFGLSSFPCCCFRDFGCGKATSFDGLFRSDRPKNIRGASQ